jgi:hypothetical protein
VAAVNPHLYRSNGFRAQVPPVFEARTDRLVLGAENDADDVTSFRRLPAARPGSGGFALSYRRLSRVSQQPAY